MRNISLSLAAAPLVAALLAFPPVANALTDLTINVDCAAGQRIGNALKWPTLFDRRLVVIVNGTCAENVTIERDDVVLRAHASGGAVSAPDSGLPAILVNGARRVTIEKLTVVGGRHGVLFAGSATGRIQGDAAIVPTISNAALDGVRIESGSYAAVEGATIQNNGQTGIRVAGAGATVTSSTLKSNGFYGAIVTRGANSVLGAVDDSGTICCGNTIENNNLNGLVVSESSSASLYANTIRNNGNSTAGYGILVAFESMVRLFGGNDVSQNGDLPGGAGGGVFLRSATLRSGQSDVALSDQSNRIRANTIGIDTGENAVLDLRGGFEVSNNTASGVVLNHGARALLNSVRISNNSAHGLFVFRNASVNFRSNTEVSGNGAFGLFCADNESSFTGDTSGVNGNTLGQVSCTGF